ncbi:MAG TPA: family 16 glycosylhydrolase [Polyangiaceae bacterium]
MSYRAFVGVLSTLAFGAGAWACSSSSGNAGESEDDASSGDSSTMRDVSPDVPGEDASNEGGGSAESGSDAPAPADAGSDGRVLTFSDEFNESSSAPDPAKWAYWSIGESASGPGWGLEDDTPSADVVQNGNLVITATQAADGGIVSGSITTKGKFQQTYGHWEASIKVPSGAGTWPAFWLMGDTNGQGWPTCGEIDIVEVVSPMPQTAYGTIHSGNTSDATQNTSTGGSYMLASGNLSDGYHLYALDWSKDSIAFSVDGHVYETITPQTVTSGQLWPFDHGFYIIFDLAIGGSWPGPPNAGTFPATMYVDYVRVYQ